MCFFLTDRNDAIKEYNLIAIETLHTIQQLIIRTSLFSSSRVSLKALRCNVFIHAGHGRQISDKGYTNCDIRLLTIIITFLIAHV